MQKVHGYVLALHDANVGNSCQWGSYGTEVGCDRNNNSGFNGYSSTQTIVAFNKDKNWNLSDAFPAVYHAVNYETVCPAPSQTSGWFLPSIGQMWNVYQNRTSLFDGKTVVSGLKSDWYWSSSEYYYDPAGYALYVYVDYGDIVDYGNKDQRGYAVRSCLAF